MLMCRIFPGASKAIKKANVMLMFQKFVLSNFVALFLENLHMSKIAVISFCIEDFCGLVWLVC